MMPLLTVTICTHNPRRSYLTRCLDALKHQTLNKSKWRLCIIDNGSTPALSSSLIDWHPDGSLIREERLGLFHARICAMTHFLSSGNSFLVFVDDDNVLESNYLEEGIKYLESNTECGALGGQLMGEFETDFPDKLKSYLNYYAVRSFDEPIICSSNPKLADDQPPGAGLFVRRELVEAYVKRKDNPLRKLLGVQGGRRGFTGEDTDLTMTAYSMGMATARIPQLRLRHLISEKRCRFSYFETLIASSSASRVLLNELHGLPQRRRSIVEFVVEWIRSYRISSLAGKIYRAQLKGEMRGMRELRKANEKR